MFAVIFPLFFVLYWSLNSLKLRNTILLIAGYVFYMNWNPAFSVILLGVTLVCYGGGIILSRSDIDDYCNKRKITICAVLLGLLPLLVFKYYNFLNDGITVIFSTLGLCYSFPGLNWAVPIGISFFTFQSVGYLLDVYHKRVPAVRDFTTFALFVSFFPQVTSGPISTPKELIPQFASLRQFQYNQVRDGLRLVLWGLFLKTVLADRLGLYVDMVYGDCYKFSSLNCLFASYLYTIQIYCDFAGYSYMAIGIARTLGFNLINNFERPYLAASVTEFWRRWHVSLTRWLTTHVYINLGGNRCSHQRQYLNIMITFLVSGLWHGANWTFIIWGALHGLFQISEKFFFGEIIKKDLNKRVSLTVARSLRIFVTFNLISFAWIFFRMPTVGDSLSLLKRIFDVFSESFKFSTDGMDILAYIPFIIIPYLACELIKEYYAPFYCHVINNIYIRWIVYITIILYIVLLGVHDGSQFIYVNF